MATKTHSHRQDPEGFDIVCTVGRVEFGESERPAHVIAFEIIAEQDMEGTFRFPMPNGQICAVTVEYEGNPILSDNSRQRAAE